MEKLYLIATIARQSIAVRAAAVESVVDIGTISPVPHAAPHIAGLAAVRSRVLTIICSERALGFPPAPQRPTRAIVVDIEGHHYGLLVNTIEDAKVIEDQPRPVNVRLEAGWARVTTGLLEFDGETLLLVDPIRLISGPGEMAA